MISIDTLSSIGQYRDWLNNLRVAKEILAIFLKDNPVDTLTSRQLIGLKYFLCAFTADQVKQLSAEEYSAAAREIGQLECPAEVLLALQEKAVEAYGDPSLWTKDEMDTVGTVTASLNSTQISSISAGTLSYITPEAISLIPSSVFRALSPDLLSSLGTENYAAVSQMQWAVLDDAQRKALNLNSGASISSTVETSSSGGPSSAAAPVLVLALTLVGLSF
ncbi:otoancorin-like [Lepisosteus oculatus]|uniref:otoancorin-like n=1 Tax=Lepisosteus oculatus TaxID=7918 RepID=UPI0035F51407